MTYLPLLERDYPAALAAMDVPEVAEMAELEGWVGWREMQSGFIYSLQGDHERSSRELLSALDKSTALGRAFGPYDYVTLASVYTLLGENAKALESITTAARQTPESLDALVQRHVDQFIDLGDRDRDGLRDLGVPLTLLNNASSLWSVSFALTLPR